jgi:hypothetical protein
MNILIKAALIALSFLTLQGCLSTERYEMATDLNATDNELARLLILANTKDDTEERKEIARVAIYAHDAASAATKSGENKLALGYYRIAAIGYWRDDIDNNNQKLFDVVKASEKICNKMSNKAPDRDCFVIRFTPLFAALEEAFIKAGVDIDVATASSTEKKNRLELLLKIGGESKGGVDFNNGALSNLVNQAAAQQGFLKKHTSLNEYVCNNLNATFSRYVSLISPFRSNVEGTVAENQLLADHPFYKAYREVPEDQVNSKEERVDHLINSKVASCKKGNAA